MKWIFVGGSGLSVGSVKVNSINCANIAYQSITKTKLDNPYTEGEGKELLEKIEQLTEPATPTEPEKQEKKPKSKIVDTDIEKINAILDKENKNED